MAILPIVTYDDELLRKKTNPVAENSTSLQTFIANLFETMYHSNGVGLAAPQVGELQRLFVMDADAITEELNEADVGPLVFINPEVVSTSGQTVKLEEGCLSIPEVRDDVKRPEKVRVRYLDSDFKEHEKEFDGWVSRIIQHEIDHLDGILFLDYLSAFRKRLHRKDLKKINRGEMPTDYPLVPKKRTV